MSGRLAAIGLLAGGLAACGGGAGTMGGTAGMAQPQASRTVIGTVAVVGSEPFPSVIIDTGTPGARGASKRIEVAGELRSELRNLSGALVRVQGALGAGDALRVTRYEVLEIAGHKPVVGILETDGSEAAVRTADGQRVRVRGAPEKLLTRPGAKVWVILSEDRILTGYGVIREP